MLYAATYSILAQDPASGRFGAAIASRLPCVGSFCIGMRAGVGGALTQAWTNPALSERLLERLAAGNSAPKALEAVVAAEIEPAMRQVAVVDRAGSAVAFTGGAVEPWRGHEIGEGWCVLGNMLPDAHPIEAMAASFDSTSDRPFAERLILALEAAHAAGGDVRGNRSAALKVVGEEAFPLVDLRVDDHAHPIEELWRLYRVAKRDLFPFVAALPTRANPRGRFEDVRAQIAPTPEDRERAAEEKESQSNEG